MTQSVVRYDYGFGVVGESRKHGARRSKPLLLVSANAALNVIGRALRYNADGKTVGVDGTGAYAGILCGPKQYASRGTAAGGPLASTIVLPNNTLIEAVEFDYSLIVQLTNNNAAIGDYIVFATTGQIGALQSVAAGAAVPANTQQIHGAAVDDLPGNASGLCTISLTGPLVPSAAGV
jgi:hypothetical protein